MIEQDKNLPHNRIAAAEWEVSVETVVNWCEAAARTFIFLADSIFQAIAVMNTRFIHSKFHNCPPFLMGACLHCMQGKVDLLQLAYKGMVIIAVQPSFGLLNISSVPPFSFKIWRQMAIPSPLL